MLSSLLPRALVNGLSGNTRVGRGRSITIIVSWLCPHGHGFLVTAKAKSRERKEDGGLLTRI